MSLDETMKLYNMMQEQSLRLAEKSHKQEMDRINKDIEKLSKLTEFIKLFNEFEAKASASPGEEKISYQKMMGKVIIKEADLMWISITDDEKQALEDGTDLLKIKQINMKVCNEAIDRL